jgi:spermidine/putrescine transport system substrate-binding protein
MSARRGRELPEDPLTRELVQQARAAAVSRRSVLAGAAGAAGLGALLAACGTGGAGGGATTGAGITPGTDVSDTEKLVRWANWTFYLDYDDDTRSRPTLEAFTEKTGIEAQYVEDIEDNDTFYGKVQSQLAQGQDIGFDIVTLTDWMTARLIRQGYVQELDHGNIPNLDNLVEGLRNVDFDPGRKKSVTWQSGYALIAWNTELVPEGLDAVSDLWKPEYKGRVEVLSEMRDTIGLIMLEQGVDISGDWGDDEFYAALEVVEEQIASGQIRQVRGNSYTEDLISGDAIAVMAWSGDIVALNFEADDKFAYKIVDSGVTLWSDNLMVPIGATHKKNAELLIDHYFEPEVAAEVAAWVNFITPVEGAREAMEAIDPELMDNELIFPDSDTLAKAHVFRSLSPEEEEKYNGDFLSVIGA